MFFNSPNEDNSQSLNQDINDQAVKHFYLEHDDTPFESMDGKQESFEFNRSGAQNDTERKDS